MHLAPTMDMAATIMASLGWQITQPRWAEEGGRYVPYPASWINARRWEDEPFHVEATPLYHGWECPHDPPCEQRHWCELKTAKEGNPDGHPR